MLQEVVVAKNKAEIQVKKDYVNILRNNEPKHGVLFTDFIVAANA